MSELLPLFLNLNGRAVLLVGGGPVATAKLRQLVAAGARVRVVAPDITREIAVSAAAAPDEGQPPATARPTDPRPAAALSRPEAAASPSPAARSSRPISTRLAGRRGGDAGGQPAGRGGRRGAANLRQRRGRSGQRQRVSERRRPARRRHAGDLDERRRAGVDRAAARRARRAAAARSGELDVEARAARVAWRRDGVPMAARKPLLLQRAQRALSGRRGETAELADKNVFAISGDLRGPASIAAARAVAERTGGLVAVTRTRLARRRRSRRSGAADADARSRGCAPPTSCSTTRWSTSGSCATRGRRSGSSSASAPAAMR